MNSLDPTALRRIKWRCRRGMLELDMMLQSFFEQRFENLDCQQQQMFTRLLDYPDQSLLEWLSGAPIDADKDVRDIVEQLRHFSSAGA
ncbi:MAG TPA: succinate dehydrogenase assembly factor 2 [Acidiferrobacteraceae bacterium]|nr:succinate dehydrogenase assembly factor 2 [Acidiferrobacteraceae bacterium]